MCYEILTSNSRQKSMFWKRKKKLWRIRVSSLLNRINWMTFDVRSFLIFLLKFLRFIKFLIFDKENEFWRKIWTKSIVYHHSMNLRMIENFLKKIKWFSLMNWNPSIILILIAELAQKSYPHAYTVNVADIVDSWYGQLFAYAYVRDGRICVLT